MQKTKLPQFKDCTGCMACFDECKHKAISIKTNKKGFYEVSVDSHKCKECGLCEAVCPIINVPQTRNYMPTAYIGWSLSDENLLNSASGGIFIELASAFLKTFNNSVVYGAIWNKDNELVLHKYTENLGDLMQFQNSKYLQSNMQGVYNSIKEHLRNSYNVLFSGTPCQVAALTNFIPNKLKKNLYTIEIICHGVPSFSLLENSKTFYNATKLESFRTKKDGWLNSQKCTYISVNKKITPHKGYDIFYNMYASEYFLRPACTHCIFASIPRKADITIGDYWGDKEKRNEKGTSLFYLNNIHAKDIIRIANIYKQKTDFYESLLSQSRISCNLYAHLERFPRIFWIKEFIKGKKGNLLYKIYFRIWNEFIKRAQKNKNEKIKKAIKEYEKNRNHYNS